MLWSGLGTKTTWLGLLFLTNIPGLVATKMAEVDLIVD